jgi:hypothetical protein
MSNNQDAVKRGPCQYHRAHEAPECHHCRAPTPREQELEAQNKVLWELVKHAENANRVLFMLTSANSIKSTSVITAYGQIVEARVKLHKVLTAIQKAKENKA